MLSSKQSFSTDQSTAEHDILIVGTVNKIFEFYNILKKGYQDERDKKSSFGIEQDKYGQL